MLGVGWVWRRSHAWHSGHLSIRAILPIFSPPRLGDYSVPRTLDLFTSPITRRRSSAMGARTEAQRGQRHRRPRSRWARRRLTGFVGRVFRHGWRSDRHLALCRRHPAQWPTPLTALPHRAVVDYDSTPASILPTQADAGGLSSVARPALPCVAAILNCLQRSVSTRNRPLLRHQPRQTGYRLIASDSMSPISPTSYQRSWTNGLYCHPTCSYLPPNSLC